jgi:putative ABC transport system permease protein
MLTLLPLIFRNVLRNRRRTLLTLTSSAISLGLLALLLAIYQGFFHGGDASPIEAMRLVCRHKVSIIQPLLASQKDQIAAIPGVQALSSYTWFGGTYKEPSNFFARFAVDSDTVFDIYKEWQIPPEQIAAFKKERTACALGSRIASQYDIKLGDTLVLEGDIYPCNLTLQVAGIFHAPAASECLIFHKDYLTESLPASDTQRDEVGSFMILTDSPENAPHVAAAIDRFMAENSPIPTRTESEKEFGRSFLAMLGNVKLFLLAICGAVTFTIMLVSANAVAMAVRERTREMAILRTLGYRQSEILQLVIGEAILISFLGGILGLLLGWALSIVVENVGALFGLQALKWQAALIVLSAAVAVGIVASLVPALIAARKNIVESLRFTG